MNPGAITVKLVLDNSTFESTAAKSQKSGKDLDKSLSDSTANASKNVKGNLSSIDAATDRTSGRFEAMRGVVTKGMLAIGAGVAAGLGISVKSASDFQSSLSQLGQASGATTDEMAALTNQAKLLGKDTDLAGVTASSAAQAMVELSKAGLSVKDTMDASKGVMSLAKAGNIDFAEAATIAASALNAFQLEGKDATKVADALAAGANASQADLADLALGMQQSATVSKQFGISLNDNVTALALFANNGIKGSDAGTSLKTMLIALAKPSDAAAKAMEQIGFNAYDAQGNFVGLEEMSKRLQTGMSGLTEQQKQNTLATIFGTDAFRAAAILADNAGASYSNMAAEVGKSGAAQQAAAAQQGGFQKAWENFSNALSDVGLTVGEKLLPPLTEFFNMLSQNIAPAMDWVIKNGELLKNVFIGIGAAILTIKTAGMVSDFAKAEKTLSLFVGKNIANGLTALGAAFKAIAVGARAFGAALMANPLILIIAGITAVIAALVFLQVKFNIFGKLFEWIGGVAKAAWDGIKTGLEAVGNFFVMIFTNVLNFIKQWGLTIVAVIFWPIALIVGLFFKFKDQIFAVFNAIWQFVSMIFTGIVNFIILVFTPIISFIVGLFQSAWDGVVMIWNAVAGFFVGVWNGIVAIFTPVVGFFVGVFQDAWNGIKAIFGAVSGFFRGVWNTITSIFTNIGTAIGGAIGGAFKNVVNTIIGFAEGTINGFIRAINGAIGLINNIPGVNIGTIGEMNIPRLAKGGIAMPQPGGILANIAEAGKPEVVMPLDRLEQFINTNQQQPQQGGAGTNIDVTVNNYDKDPDLGKKIANQMAWDLRTA